MNNIDLNKIKELLLSKDKETISLGIEFLISDYTDLYNELRNTYPNKKIFDAVIYHLIHGDNSRRFSRFSYSEFINTSIIFYIDGYIYEQFN